MHCAGPSSIVGWSQKLDAVHDLLLQQTADNVTISISKVKASVFEQMTKTAGLRFVACQDLHLSKTPRNSACSESAFLWEDGSEASHASAYLKHLETTFCIDVKRFSWVNGAKYRQLLDCNATTTLGNKFRGNTDVAVVSLQSERLGAPEIGLEVMFELKKGKPTPEHARQAMTALLIGNLKSTDSKPIMVRQTAHPISSLTTMTDLVSVCACVETRAWACV